MRLFYGFLILFLVSDVFASMLSVSLIWRFRGNRLADFTSVLVAALTVDSLCQLAAGILRPANIHYPVAVMVFALVGRFIKTTGQWMFVAFLSGATFARQK